MPSTPSGRRPPPRRVPSSSSTYTSWWASAQSTPTKIIWLLSIDRHQHRARGPQQPPNGSVLLARHPTSRHGNLADQQGHDLALRLLAPGTTVLTHWRLSSTSISRSAVEMVDPH